MRHKLRHVFFLIFSLNSYTTFQPYVLLRSYRDEQGNKRQPGLKDLPQWLRDSFRVRFIRHVIEQMCLSNVLWNNPSLESLQHELNRVYPTDRIRLHSDDACVIPVCFSCCSAGVSKQN